jgi:CubicO group peptidase (beta-lactamase class C family)
MGGELPHHRSVLALAEQAVAGGAMPGLALALVERDGRIIELAFGVAEARTGQPLMPVHVFQAASLAKMVTALAVLRLAARGELDLDRQIEDRLTRWRLPDSAFDSRGVTARRVLAHMAGLSLPDYPGFPPDARLPTLEESLSGATNGGGGLCLIAPPGGSFRYSGGGFALLQLLIEEVTGEAFASHIRRTVFAPLAMASSGFTSDPALVARAAGGHDASGASVPFYRFDGLAAAGLLATAGDLARFVRVLMAAPEAPMMMRAAAETGRVDAMWPWYGLGCEIDQRSDGRLIAGHHGINRGWRALLAMDAARGRGLALLANGDNAMPALEAIYEAWVG